MGIEEDFYGTIKFKNGEEIFAKIAASEEETRTVLLISCPIMVFEVKKRDGSVAGYKVEPWLKTTTEDMFVLDMDDVLTMSESSDIHMITMYQSFVRQSDTSSRPSVTNNSNQKLNREMGYISSVSDAKDILEKIFKKS
jgi:hypothetical protein|tara:strand:+ start:1273 stop:1689 length:417 start_codon:yes stop_codon:yes gene_type:complete